MTNTIVLSIVSVAPDLVLLIMVNTRFFNLPLLLFIGTIANVSVAFSQVTLLPENYFLKNPQVPDLDLHDVEYGDSTWVAVGDDGVISTSTDGLRWKSQLLLGAPTLTDVIYVNGTWMALGREGDRFSHLRSRLLVYRSSDAVHWDLYPIDVSTISAKDEFFIEHAHGTFVAVGGAEKEQDGSYLSGSLILHSEDGLSWQPQFLNTRFAPNSVDHGNGLWAMATRNRLFTSLNGQDWIEKENPFEHKVRKIGFRDGKWIAIMDRANGFFVSDNFGEWTLIEDSFRISAKDILHINGSWLVLNDNDGIMDTSDDGVNWLRRLTTHPNSMVQSIHHAEGRFVAVGLDGYIGTSKDLIHWQEVSGSEFDNHVGDIEYGGGEWRIAAAGEIFVSEDMVHWRREWFDRYAIDLEFGDGQWMAAGNDEYLYLLNSSAMWELVNLPSSADDIRAIRYADNRWMAVGDENEVVRDSRGTIMVTARYLSLFTSGDGITWEEVSVSRPLNWGAYDFEFGNGIWVFGGSENGTSAVQTFRSSDLWTKTVFDSGAHHVENIEYGEGVWLATQGISIRRSSNGIDWEDPITLDSRAGIRSIIHGNSHWLALDSNGTLWRSSDGLSWAKHIEFFVAPDWAYDTKIHFDSGIWVAANRNSNGLQIRTSADGIVWTTVLGGSNSESLLRGKDIYDLEYGNGKWIANTRNKGLLESANLVSWSPIPIELGPESWISDLAYSSGTWVTAGQGVVLQSSDSIEWSQFNLTGEQKVQAGTFADGLWVHAAVDHGFFDGQSETTIFSSRDGLEWIPESLLQSAEVNALHYGGGQWVAVGLDWEKHGYGIWVSKDLVSWKRAEIVDDPKLSSIGLLCRSLPPPFLTDVAYGNGLWVATGRIWNCGDGGGPPGFGEVLVSRNAKQWYTVALSDWPRFQNLKFHEGRWIFAGEEGVIVETSMMDPFLSILSNSLTGDLTLSWPAYAKDYQLESAPNLDEAFMPVIGGNRFQSESDIVEVFPATGSQRFFQFIKN